MHNFYPVLQMGLLVVLAPLLSGVIAKIKNTLRLRRGPGILQPYYNLAKYFSKEEVVSEHASWVFYVAPYVVFSSTVLAAALVPLFLPFNSAGYLGDFLALVFLLALGRFFLALGGLDVASAFSGMGSSREMFISSLVEPVLLLVVLTLSLNAGTTGFAGIFGAHPITFSSGLAVVALFLVTLAETGRIPIDNQETHLELTMVHEAMLLEYSGRSLALLEISAYIKQLIFFALLAGLVLPLYSNTFVFLCVKILVVAVVTALTELSFAKMRLFRVVDYLAFSGIIGFLSVIAFALGI